MTAPRTVVATSHSAAPVETVWPLLAHASRWREWAAFTVSELERAGSPQADGMGAVRRFGFPLFTSREEVVTFEPPHHLGYVLRSGLPLRGYESDVTLTAAADGGTDIEWRSSFEPPWPATGWFWSAFMRLLLSDFSRRLARAAAR